MGKKLFVVTSFYLLLSGPVGYAQQPTKIGEYVFNVNGPFLSTTDARDPSNISLVDMVISEFIQNAGKTSHQFNRVYVSGGNTVRQFNRNDLQSGQLQEFISASEVLDLEDGSILGQIVVLDRDAVRIVDFNSSPSPRVLGAFPISSSQTVWGNLLERFGDYLYIADCSVHGFRILDISNPSTILNLGTYPTSVKGTGKNISSCPTDIQLRNGLISLVVRNSIEVIRVGDYLYPTPSPILVKKVQGVTELELQGNFAFLVDGTRIRIVDINQDSPNFGTEVSNFDTGQTITALVQRDKRLYVVCGDQGYQIWDVSAFS